LFLRVLPVKHLKMKQFKSFCPTHACTTPTEQTRGGVWIVVCVFPFIFVIDAALLFLYGIMFFVYAHSLGCHRTYFPAPRSLFYICFSLPIHIWFLSVDCIHCRCCHLLHFSASPASAAFTAAASTAAAATATTAAAPAPAPAPALPLPPLRSGCRYLCCAATATATATLRCCRRPPPLPPPLCCCCLTPPLRCRRCSHRCAATAATAAAAAAAVAATATATTTTALPLPLLPLLPLLPPLPLPPPPPLLFAV
jgi:hypothetical protein